MKKVAHNNTKKICMYASALAGLAVTLVLSSGAMASQDQLASLRVPGIERPSSNIDLAALETKISNTDAINIFAKLQIRNRIDTLTDEAGQIYNGQSSISIKELKSRFEEFFHNTVAMLRKGDPSLADELAKSRDRLWQVLTTVKVELPDFPVIDTDNP
jgi:hypothetical protein